MSLYRDANLRHAGLAIAGLALLVGAVGGSAIEGALCEVPPTYARVSFLLFAAVVLIGDLAYRHAHVAAAEREGWRRFVNPLSGGRLFVVPLWWLGAPLFLYALAGGLSAGFCG